MIHKRKIVVWLLSIVILTFAVGCKKKVAVTPPPPPPKSEITTPAPKAPSISLFEAEPGTIQRGQSATLRWKIRDATEVTISQGVGAVSATGGTRQVSPSDTAEYTLTAKGPGGSATRTAMVNVTVPPPPPPVASQPPTSLRDRLANEVQDAYFDFDKSNVREDARATLGKDSDALKAILGDLPSATLVVEGHCDERGLEEYNLALGARRADSAKDFLTQLGVPAGRMMAVSYGKDRPQCTESNEACWQKNRRVHFAPGENKSAMEISNQAATGGAQ